MRLPKMLLGIALLLSCAVVITAQQSTEPRAALNGAATASDAKGAAAIEARLLTTVLNGSEDSPVTNVRIVVKNAGANFYTYVSGWATFYDSSAVRCGEGLFKLDALAPNESAEVDTPGLRLHCSPASWRIVATNLLSRTDEGTKAIETAPPPSEAVTEKSAPINFVISIDGEEHPIQVNNPIVLKLGNRNAKIVLRPAP
ncbi:MAG: hypothetical protein DMF75_09445 [Acidobacteria bacterium]|nr:MAG: hypothetical protein DMF75_09445 [Acidobacteriota bacterium]PYS65258.1 MAG: hypothetical protein DMF76_03160 [Acidobacteriota bacterium]